MTRNPVRHESDTSVRTAHEGGAQPEPPPILGKLLAILSEQADHAVMQCAKLLLGHAHLAESGTLPIPEGSARR